MSMKCHEFFGCKKTNCIMFEEEEYRLCWEIDPALTPCIDLATEGLLDMKDKLNYCKNCLYYEHIIKTNDQIFITCQHHKKSAALKT